MSEKQCRYLQSLCNSCFPYLDVGDAIEQVWQQDAYLLGRGPVPSWPSIHPSDATELIDALISIGHQQRHARPMSAAQRAFIESLLTERAVGSVQAALRSAWEDTRAFEFPPPHWPQMSSPQAKLFIDWLRDAPRELPVWDTDD